MSSALFSRALALSALAAPLVVGACLIPLGGGEVGELRVSWAFEDDATCAELDIDTVALQVTSKEVVSGADADCVAGAALLTDLAPGAYDIALDAIGANARYAAREELEVEAGYTSDEGIVTLQPVTAHIDVGWTFAGDPRCEEAGVNTVSVQVIDDDGLSVAGDDVDCLAGPLSVPLLPAEHLTFVVEGLAGTERLWRNTEAITLTVGENSPLAVSLEPTFSRARVRWLFAAAGGTADCAAAGVETVTVQVFDAADVAVTGGSFGCTASVADFDRLNPSAYRFVADGYSGTGDLVAQETSGTPRGVTQTLSLGDNDVVVTLE